jgi:dTDP-4-dehydrorhamnose reductase
MTGMTRAQATGPVLVVGASGTLGAAIVAALELQGRRVFRASRRGDAETAGLDLSKNAEAWPLPAGIVVAHLCAAVTSIAECRDRPDAARAVNVEGIVTLARRLVATGSRVVFPSTNMVFAGDQPFARHDAPRSPRTAYGRMKAEAEHRLLDLGEAVRVVRLSKVLGRRVPLFENWRTALAAGAPIHPIADMAIAPVLLARAADALVRAGDDGADRIVHLSATGDVSYADVARRLAVIMDADPELVQPRTVAEAGLVVEHTPRHTTLDMSRVEAALGIGAPDPWQAIEEALAP